MSDSEGREGEDGELGDRRGGGWSAWHCVCDYVIVCVLLETVWCSVVTRYLDDPYLLNEKQKICAIKTSFYAHTCNFHEFLLEGAEVGLASF